MTRRRHDPADCVVCVELPHLAGYGLPMWFISDKLGRSIAAIARHVRQYPDLGSRLSATARDELRRADSADRHTRSSRPKENAA